MILWLELATSIGNAINNDDEHVMMNDHKMEEKAGQAEAESKLRGCGLGLALSSSVD